MSEPITILKPVINETKVTVQNVMIGKRQLTQRVFRQIQQEKFLNLYDGILKGDIWGYVNYFWKDNRHLEGKCKHILWVTENGELRRAFINKDSFYSDPFADTKNGNSIYQIYMTKDGDNLLLVFQINKVYHNYLDHFDVDYSFDPFVLMDGINVLKSRISTRRHNGWYIYLEGSSSKEIPYSDYRDKDYMGSIKRFYPDIAPYIMKSIALSADIVNMAHKQYKKAVLPKIHHELKKYYTSLPQLYIAV
jgi:hypothetical protein